MPTESEVLGMLDDYLGPYKDQSYIYQHVHAAHQCTDCHSRFMLHSALHVVNALGSPKAAFDFFSTDLRTNLYTLVVGETEISRKTTAIDWAVKVLQGAHQKGYLLLDVASREGLIRKLQENPHRLMVIKEGEDFLGNTHRHRQSGYQRQVRAALTRLHDDFEMEHNVRDEKKSLEVRSAHLSTIIACTPSHLDDNVDKTDIAGGFLNRFYIVHETREREYSVEELRNRPRSSVVRAPLSQMVWDRVSYRLDGNPTYPPAGLTEDSAKILKSWQQHIAKIKIGLREAEEQALRRAVLKVLRVAMLVGIDIGCAYHEGWLIPAHVMAVATQVTHWCFEDALEIVEGLSSTSYERDRRAILRLLQRKLGRGLKSMSYAQIANGLSPRLAKKILTERLDSMVDEKSIVYGGNRYRLPEAAEAPEPEPEPEPPTYDDEEPIPMSADDVYYGSA